MRAKRLRTSLIILIVLAGLLVGADFIAQSVAQARIAADIQQHGFPQKPSVTIEGFPFLTQVASRDLHQIRISARDVTEGPVRISDVSAVLTGIRLASGFTSGTVGRLTGSLLVTFPELASIVRSQIGSLGSLAGRLPLAFSAAGPDEVKASLNLGVASGSATWRVSRPNGQELNASLVSSSGVPSELLGPLSDFTVRIPQLPLGVRIGSVSVTPAGITGGLTGRNLPFGS